MKYLIGSQAKLSSIAIQVDTVLGYPDAATDTQTWSLLMTHPTKANLFAYPVPPMDGLPDDLKATLSAGVDLTPDWFPSWP